MARERLMVTVPSLAFSRLRLLILRPNLMHKRRRGGQLIALVIVIVALSTIPRAV